MEDTYLAEIHRVEEKKRRKLEEENHKYNFLSPEDNEDKQKHLPDSLYNFEWSGMDGETMGLSECK